MSTRRIAITFASGLIFALGLGVAGMTQPAKVVGFLDITGAWDPSLAFVMMGAIAVHFVAYRLVPGMPAPWYGERFGIPTRRDVDKRLVAGAVLFGAGWGLGGYCPGPGLVSMTTGASPVLIFVGSMLAGMGLFQVFEAALKRLKPPGSEAPVVDVSKVETLREPAAS